MERLSRQFGIDRRLWPFFLLSTGISSALALAAQMVVPFLEGMPAGREEGASYMGAVAFVILTLVVLLQFSPVVLPFWLLGWAGGWYLMRRARLADLPCAVGAMVMAVAAALVLGWVARGASVEPVQHVRLLPVLIAGGLVAAYFVYRARPFGVVRRRQGMRNRR